MKRLFALLFAVTMSPGAWAQQNLGDLLDDQTPPAPPGESRNVGPGLSNLPTSPPRDTATAFQNVIREYEGAVALVVAMMQSQNGEWTPMPFGTAWAFEPDRLATNAHVVEAALKYNEKGGPIYVIPNRSRGESFMVVAAERHPNYDHKTPNPQGKAPSGIPYDMGIMQIDGQFPKTVRLASPEELAALDSATPVAFVGFPTERLMGGNVNVNNPVATVQTGVITSMSDYYLEDRGFEHNKLIRHNMEATGGASGSPIFSSSGSVIGALNGVNMEFVTFVRDDGTLGVRRTPMSVGVNFGQRIDILDDIR